jgi:hypothetical protein
LEVREWAGSFSDFFPIASVLGARAELDTACRAENRDVATAHLKLFSLHMQRAGEMDPPPLRPPAAVELDWLQRCAPLHERWLA